MFIVLLIAALLIPPPAFSMTVDTPAATVWLLNSDERVQEVEITALPACTPCRVSVPLHELVNVPLTIPTPAPRCGTQAYDLIVSGVVVSGSADLIGASIGRVQTSILTTTPCPVHVYMPVS